MAYNQDTPDAITEAFSVSQPKVKENFTQIKTLVDQDHETFGAANGGGKHKQVTFPDMTLSGTLPLETFSAEVALYATGGNLFFRPVSRAAGNVDKDIDFTTSTQAVLGSTTLPSGIVLNWGTVNLAGGAPSGVISLDKDVTTLYSFTYSANTHAVGDVENVLLSHAFAAGPPSTITVTRVTSVDNVTFHWFAIGV